MDKRTFLKLLDDARAKLDAMPDGELDTVQICYGVITEGCGHQDGYEGVVLEVDRADGWKLAQCFDDDDHAADAEAVAAVADANPSPWDKLEQCCLDARPAVATGEPARG